MKWNTRIEKLFVDLRTDTLLQNIVSSMEIIQVEPQHKLEKYKGDIPYYKNISNEGVRIS